MLPDSKETKLGSDQEVSLSAGKNTGVLLVPCLHMEVHPYSFFWLCGYFWGSRVLFVMTDEFSSEGHKNYFKDWCPINSQPTFLFLTYLHLMNYGHIIKSM